MLAEMITDSDSEEVARVGRDHSSLGIENQGQRSRSQVRVSKDSK